ncbi:MAG: DNA polymerase III subunit delta [Fimbriimonadaceae bacterium]
MTVDAVGALKHRLILIEGDFASERKKALDAILQAADLADDDAFDREMIMASEKSIGEWISAASTVPFLADRRCVVVRNVLRVNPDDEELKNTLSQLKSLPESALLILVADDEVRKDDDVSKQAGLAGPWRKAVKAMGGHILVFTLESAKGGRNLQDLVKASGKKLAPRTQNVLMEMVAGRPDRAEEELEKLILYVGSAQEITVEDVKRSVSAEPEHNIFQMCDACWRGDAGRALAQLQKLRGQTRDFQTEAIKLIGFIAMQLRNIWQARGFIEKNPQGWEPEKGGLSKMKDFPRRKAIENAQRLSFTQILECQLALREASALITGQSLGVDSEETIEQLILRLCQISAVRRSA